MKEYIVSVEFSTITGLRYCSESDFSGEEFYHKLLNGWFAEAFSKKEQFKVILDGGEDGYGPSFRDEAFGNLIYDFSKAEVERWMVLEAPGDDLWREDIVDYTFEEWEERRKSGAKPKKTENHPEWYRLDNGQLDKKVWINKNE